MTSALALAGVALTAVSGCVTVVGGPRPETDAPTSPPTGGPAPPERDGRPRIVPGPAREALARAPVETGGPPGADSGPTREGGQPSSSAPPAPLPPSGPRPTPRRPPREHVPPGGDRPGRASTGAPTWSGRELCVLGERYGGWAPHSEQARLCREVYGD
ncbi:MAG TPA: hypothetical protein VFY14_19860 [Streptomyces sp.]|nr:hypothetical protein [Streptomyces sp.]